MALPSSFQARLQQMEETRRQRLALLKAERELQLKKYHLLAVKSANRRRMAQRCLLLESAGAELGYRILTKKDEIGALDAKREEIARELRALRSESEGLVEREKERDRFYEEKRLEMEEFNVRQRKFLSDTREEVQKLRDSVSQLKSRLKNLQDNLGYQNNPEIAGAEARRSELLAEKEGLDKSLASSYQLRSLLRRQVQKMLKTKDRGQASTTEVQGES